MKPMLEGMIVIVQSMKQEAQSQLKRIFHLA